MCVRLPQQRIQRRETTEVKGKSNKKVTNPREETVETETLVFPVPYFEKLEEIKSIVNNLKDEIDEFIEDTRVKSAVKNIVLLKTRWLEIRNSALKGRSSMGKSAMHQAANSAHWSIKKLDLYFMANLF